MRRGAAPSSKKGSIQSASSEGGEVLEKGGAYLMKWSSCLSAEEWGVGT